MRVFEKIGLALTTTLLIVVAVPAMAYDNFSQSSQIKAYGNDPDWSLEIPGSSNKLVFTIDGETTTYKYASMGPTIKLDKKTMVYRVPNDRHALSIFVKGKACRDDATGKSHEVTVIIAYDGKGYGGCGDVLNH
jgi:uncharacterized membrane protein